MTIHTFNGARFSVIKFPLWDADTVLSSGSTTVSVTGTPSVRLTFYNTVAVAPTAVTTAAATLVAAMRSAIEAAAHGAVLFDAAIKTVSTAITATASVTARALVTHGVRASSAASATWGVIATMWRGARTSSSAAAVTSSVANLELNTPATGSPSAVGVAASVRQLAASGATPATAVGDVTAGLVVSLSATQAASADYTVVNFETTIRNAPEERQMFVAYEDRTMRVEE